MLPVVAPLGYPAVVGLLFWPAPQGRAVGYPHTRGKTGRYVFIHLTFGVSRGSPAALGHSPCLFRVSRGIHRQDGKVETHATIMHREVRLGTCSANVWRLQAAQKNRRTISRIATRCLPTAASVSRLA